MVNLDREINGVLAASRPAHVVVADTVRTVAGKRAAPQGVNVIRQGKGIHEEHCRGVQPDGRNLGAESARLHRYWLRRSRLYRRIQTARPVSLVDACPEGGALEGAIRLRSRRGNRVPDPVTNDDWVFAEVSLAHQGGWNGNSVVAALEKYLR